MVPLAGDTPRKVLRAIVADVTALSTRLGGKQLTVRLLLVPGRKAGDTTGFNSPYLVNGPVLGIENEPKKELEKSMFDIKPIRSL